MRVLVATRMGQGRRTLDVCNTIEGELVALLPEEGCCALHRLCASGITSIRETTTFMVVDRPELDVFTYVAIFRDEMPRWYRGVDGPLATEIALEALRIASGFPRSTILERDGDTVGVRMFPDWSWGDAA
jgi:hypothetical protein